MTQPRSAYLPLLGHDIHITEWGTRDLPALVMWHGLARTGRDFDELASALSDRYFVLCPDTIGRGLSSWSERPDEEYDLDHYARIALAIFDHYGIGRANWLGTSMGGLIGMKIAAGAGAARLKSLIINDIGPETPAAAIERIVTYAAQLPAWETMAEAEAWLRTVYAPFGPAPDAFWQRMAETSVRRRDDGKLTLHYDPHIIDILTVNPDTLVLWDDWAQIALPCHVFAGAQSDILTADIRARMIGTGPAPGLTEFADCGHAPALAGPDDAALVARLLDELSG